MLFGMLEGDLSTGWQVKVDEFFGVFGCSLWRVWLDSPSQPENQLRAEGLLPSPRKRVSDIPWGIFLCRQEIEIQPGQIKPTLPIILSFLTSTGSVWLLRAPGSSAVAGLGSAGGANGNGNRRDLLDAFPGQSPGQFLAIDHSRWRS